MSIFHFNYKKPEDLGPTIMVLTPGEAKFKVVSIFDKKKDGSPLTTMDGTPKLTMSLSVTDSAGNNSLVYDDLTAKTAWKIKTLLDSIGLGELYDPSGAFSPEDVIGAMGKCMIETRHTEGYDDRSNVKKYIKAAKQAVIPRDSVPVEEPSDDDLPF